MRSDDTETAKVYNKFICQRVMVEIYKGCKTKALLIKDGSEDEFMDDDTVKLYILREWMPPDKHEVILSKWFGSQGLGRAGISQHPVGTLKELLDADQATSLDALAGRVGTVPGLLADILSDIQGLGKKPEEEEREPRMRTWRPNAITKGMVIRKNEAIEIADRFRDELEEQFEEGVEEIIIQ